MLPHDKVFTRLGLSEIHGIGVFAITDIGKNIFLFEYDNTQIVWVKNTAIQHTSPKIKKMYDDFCVSNKDRSLFACPENFNQLTMSWYMNHSDNPNVGPDAEFNFHTLKEIKEGEELTINYNDFEQFL